MKQTIHIFKKDLQRFSWEIATSLILLAVYAWGQPAFWGPLGMFSSDAGLRSMVSKLAAVVLGLAWMIIVVRSVYEDAPAGDRQFWITRPYRWGNLLAAKILFLCAVINVPLFVVQLVLLRMAGFAPFHDLHRVIVIQFVLAAFLLCVATIAVITANRTQLSRAAIVILIFLVTWTWMGTFTYSFVPGAKASASTWLVYTLLLGLPALVVVRQYALRKTAQARWILFAGALLLTALNFAAPQETIDADSYPPLPAGADPYFKMSMPAPKRAETVRYPGVPEKKDGVFIDFNVVGSDVAAGQVIEVDAIDITLQAADGAQWSSGWSPSYAVLEHEENAAQNSGERPPHPISSIYKVPQSFMDHAKSAPVSIHVAVAATLFQDDPGTAIAPDDRGEMKVPGVGICTVPPAHFPMIQCRSAAEPKQLLGISRRSFISCPPTEKDLAGPFTQTTTWVPRQQWDIFGLSPVGTITPFFERYRGHEQELTICPEDSHLFRQPKKIRQFRVEQDFTKSYMIQ